MGITPNYSCDCFNNNVVVLLMGLCCLIKFFFSGGGGGGETLFLFYFQFYLIVPNLFLILIFGKHDRVSNAYNLVHMW